MITHMLTVELFTYWLARASYSSAFIGHIQQFEYSAKGGFARERESEREKERKRERDTERERERERERESYGRT